MILARALFSTFKSWRMYWFRRQLENNHPLISNVRGSLDRPVLFEAKSPKLFYKPNMVLFVLQMVFLAALAVWTIKNYIGVFKSL